MRTLTIATRGSALALWQAEHIKARVLALCAEPTEIQLLVLKTQGDIIQNVPLSQVGGKGLFVKEIEEALLDGRADIAVHSMKDLPMAQPDGLVLGPVPERESAADLFLSANFPTLESLPAGSLVGTSSLRRQAQVLALRPDLRVASLRGNVDTRLRKLLEGQYDAIIMAQAGMKRLGLAAPHQQALPVDRFVPAAGQGALGLEFREDRADLAALLQPLDHPATRACVMAERAFLATLEGNCQVPIAAHAVMEAGIGTEETLFLTGVVMNPSGTSAIRREGNGLVKDAPHLGRSLADAVIAAGGTELLRGRQTDTTS